MGPTIWLLIYRTSRSLISVSVVLCGDKSVFQRSVMHITHYHNVSLCKCWLIVQKMSQRNVKFFFKVLKIQTTIVKFIMRSHPASFSASMSDGMDVQCDCNKFKICWRKYQHARLIFTVLSCKFIREKLVSSRVTKIKACLSTYFGSWRNRAGLFKTVQCICYPFMH